jgi:PAS domain S-box-containing protein
VTPPVPANEAERLKALRAYDVLDTDPEEAFDDLAAVASHIAGTPIALVSLVDAERQFLKARRGIDAAETSRDVSFCAHAINKPDEVLVVPDATKDDRFADNPLVVKDPSIRFYAGAPLVTHDGLGLGALCVIDQKPHEFGEAQQKALQRLAKQVIYLLELRQASREVVRSGARQRMVLDASLDAIISMGSDGLITGWNRQAEAMFGYDADEAIGRSLNDTIVPPDFRQKHAAGLERYLDTGESTILNKRIEVPAARRDGEIFPAEVSIVPMHSSDGIIEFGGFIRDVSEQKAAQEALSASTRRLERIAQNTPGMLFQAHLGLDGVMRFSYVSEGVKAIYGFEVQQVIDDGNLVMNSVIDQDKASLGEAIVRSVEELSGFEWTGRIRDIDEVVKHVTVRSRPERRKDGSTMWDGIITDVSHEKEAERQPVAATEQAKTLAKRAEEASTAKSAFLANMSHEIRTPLSHVISFGDLVEKNLAAELQGVPADVPMPPEQQLEAVRTINRSGKHLLTVLNDILDLSKIEAGKMEVELIDVDPANIAEDVVSVARLNATAKGLAMEVDYATPLPKTLKADPTRLRQGLLNLLGNAVKFTKSGGILLRLSVDDVDYPAEVRFEVFDTGIGITEEQRQRLFESFQQADNSTSRKFGGTGLGLVLSRQFARLMNGDLTCRSTHGRGSVFTFSIPLSEPTSTVMIHHNTPPHETPSPKGPLAGHNILVVEDGPENQWLIGIHLRNAGANVVAATDGKQGVDAFFGNEDVAFDAILLDMQMPVMDGYTAAAELRKRGCETPIIAFTAHAMSGDREKCLAAGCDAYQTKPINGPDLIAELQNLIANGRPSASKAA